MLYFIPGYIVTAKFSRCQTMKTLNKLGVSKALYHIMISFERVAQRIGRKHSQFIGFCRENSKRHINVFVLVAIWKE